MSRVRVICVDAGKRDALTDAAADYLSRAGRRFDAELVILPPQKRGKGSDDERVRDAEADALLKASELSSRVALDAGGDELASSEAFAKALEDLLARGKPVSFLVGGATGLHPRVKQGAAKVWSLSRLTFAHRLAVVVVAEQIYRAAEIARGGPYHK